MDQTQLCQRCGERLNSQNGRASEGLCPRCLLESATRLIAAFGDDRSAPLSEATAGETPPAEPLPLGRLGHYELIERIASGGMGVVYRARQPGLNRIVALKVLPFGPFTREELVKRFQIEAGAAAKLRHPNIVTIFEVGKADGYPFFSMEFVEGTTLAELVRDYPVPAARAVRLVRTIAEAIHYAHQQGILHRDLKPSNVMVDALDQPRITDFGLARDFAEQSDLTLTGHAFGSPNFMPPEQAKGCRTEVGARSDVYGLGAILYHLLTGRPPFSADSAATVLQQVLQNDPPAPRVLNSSIPRDLETICLKCLDKEPARRYATAQNLADELARFQRGEPIFARSIGYAARVWRWSRRRPAIAILLTALLLVFSAGLIATLAQWRRAESAAARLAENVTRLEIDRAEDWLERGETPNGLAQLANVLRREPDNRVAGNRILAVLSQRRFILPTDLVIQEDFVGRNSAFAQHGNWIVTATNRSKTLQLWDTRPGLRLVRHMECGEPVRVTSFRGDGRQLVAATANGTMLVFDAPADVERLELVAQGPVGGPHKVGGYIDRIVLSPDGAHAIAHLSGPNSDDWKRAKLIVTDVATGRTVREETNMHWAAFSPDGKWLVTISGRAAQLRNPVTWEAVGPALQHGARINTAEFNADSRLLVTASADNAARLWHVETGERVGSAMRHELQVLSAVFSPDGNRVLTKDLGRQSQLWNATNGLPVGQPFQQAKGITINSFSPDGALVLAFLESKIRLHDAMTGKLVAEPLDTGHVVPRARFIGSGHRVLTSTFGGEAQVWNIPALEASHRRLDHRGEINAIAISPDGAMVAAGIRTTAAGVWDASSGTSVASLAHGGQVLDVAFDSTGGRLVTASVDGTARVWELPSGRQVGEPLRHERPVFKASFSRDGQWLVTCSEDFTARLWDAHTLQAVGAPLRHRGDVRAAAFHPDGKIVATAGIDNTVRLWSVPEGNPLGEPVRHSNWVSAIVFSPDGNLLASCGSERSARLWNVSKGLDPGASNRLVVEIRAFLRHEGHVTSVQFDTSGKRVLTASDDRTARLWTASTGEALARPLHHTDRVAWAGFSPDGRFVLTASNDGTARVWDSRTGHPVTDTLRHDDIATSARWSPRGDFAVTGSYDRTVRIWPLGFLSAEPPPQWLPELAEAVGGKRLIGDHLHAPVPPKEFLELRARLLNQVESEPHRGWLETFFTARDEMRE